MNFGAAIRRLRLARGWKQDELARRSGIRQGYVSDIELGKKENPTQETLAKLAAAFEISIAELLAEAGAVGIRVKPLPTENLPPSLAALARQWGPYLNERDWERVAGFLEALGRERAEREAAHGFQADEDATEGDQPSSQHGAA